MILLRLALRSLLARRVTAGLTLLAVALSVALLLAVEKVRTGARASFADTISGTDLVVGARTGGVQLLLYAVFRIGNATNNITWESFEAIAAHPDVAWAVPLSLGDSHRGFRVLGTELGYFERYRFRGGRALELAEGRLWEDLFEAVIGAEVAEALGYRVGDPLVVAHGLASFAEHDDRPFRVAGILARTGTPVDRTVHVSLAAIEAIHVDWQGGARRPGAGLGEAEIRALDLRPKAVTAALVGVKSRLAVFRLQRWINDYPEEPLLAVLPGVALQELWSVVGVAEAALAAVSAMVVVTAILGLTAMTFAGLEARRREMAILRAVGARPRVVILLLVTEAGLLAGLGIGLGLAFAEAGLRLARPLVDQAWGLALPLGPPGPRELLMLAAVLAAALLAGLLPALRAYRQSVADGMTVRL